MKLILGIYTLATITIFTLVTLLAAGEGRADKRSIYCKEIASGKYKGSFICGGRDGLPELLCKYQFSTDGCSVQPSRLNKTVLGRAKKYFYKSCDYHDICYYLGSSKGTCDRVFRDKMFTQCDNDSGSGKKPALCKTAARLFYEDVKRGSRHQSSFKSNQRDAADKKCGPLKRVQVEIIDYECPKFTHLLHNDPLSRSGKIRKLKNGNLILGHTLIEPRWLEPDGDFSKNNWLCIKNLNRRTDYEKG